MCTVQIHILVLNLFLVGVCICRAQFFLTAAGRYHDAAHQITKWKKNILKYGNCIKS